MCQWLLCTYIYINTYICMYTYINSHPKCLKTMRINDLHARALGRQVPSNSPSGMWENVVSAHCSARNANGFQGQVYRPQSLHVPGLPPLHTHMSGLPSFLQPPFPSAHTWISAVSSEMTSAEHSLKARLATWKPRLAGFSRVLSFEKTGGCI